MIDLLPMAVFAIVAGTIWALYKGVEAKVNKRRILRRLAGEKTRLIEDRSSSGALGLLIHLGSLLLPKSEAEREKVLQRLNRAGFQTNHGLELFYGLRAISAFGFGAAVFSLLMPWRGLSSQTLVLSYLALMLGYYAPAWAIRWRQKERTRRIVQELPDTLDILLVCMNAGLSFDRALLRVSRDMHYVAPVLSRELERYFYEVDSGLPRREALSNLAERNQVNELTSVVNVLLQSVRFGTDIAQALHIHADSLRTERRQQAEEKAAKVSTKLVIPRSSLSCRPC